MAVPRLFGRIPPSFVFVVLLVVMLIEILGEPTVATAADRRPDPSRLTIAALNARFLFDGRPPEGEADFPWKGNAARAREHLRDIAGIVRGLDADLVHISEVEDLETLERLVLETGDDSYRAFLVPGRDDFTRQNVGLLSRIDPAGPLTRSEEWARGPGGGPLQGLSKHYAAAIDVRGLEILVIGVHLLAFPEDLERAPRRESQAEVLRRLAVAEGSGKGREVIVLGDFNDYDPEVPDAAGSVPVTRVLQIVRGMDPASTADDLFNPAILLDPAKRFSSFVDRNQNGVDDGLPERTLTDHILIPAALEPDIEAIDVDASHDPIAVTDHFPIRLTLRLPAGAGEEARRGDSNLDGTIDEADALGILAHLFLGIRARCEEALDADGDGRVLLTDAVHLLESIFREGAAPGVDPVGCATWR